MANHGSGDVSVFDRETRRLLRRATVGAAPHHVAFSPDGRAAYVVSEGAGELIVIDRRGGVAVR